MPHSVALADDLSVTIDVTLEPTELQAAFDEVFEGYAKEIQLPGFRKGKAPRKLVEAQIAQRVGREHYVGSAIEKAISKSLNTVLEEEKLVPFTQPHVHPDDLVQQYKEGEPLQYQAHFHKRPDLPAFPYKGIAVRIPLRDLQEKDIDLSLENIRIRLAETEPVAADTAAEIGHWAHIRLRAWHPESDTNRPALFDNELDVQVGPGDRNLPFLDDDLIGLKIGETLDTKAVVPADFVQPPFPEDTELILKIDLQSLDKKILPELTDELVKEKLGVYDSVDALRIAVREQLDQHLRSSKQDDLRVAIESYLLQAVGFSMPQVAVQGRYEEIKNRTLYQAKTEGKDLEAEMAADEAMREQYEHSFWDAAEKTARLDFIADSVAERERLQVTEQELTNYVYSVAQQSGLPEADMPKLFQDRNFMMGAYLRLVRGKAWWVMITNAEVEEVPLSPTAEGLVAAPSATAQAFMEAAEQTVEALEALSGDSGEEK
ncbi:MAG: trigger factor [bacterium]